MARRVFFSFHYERDVWRTGQIRNSWVTKPDREAAGFIDAASWEQVRKQGSDAIKRWIDNQLLGSSVTIVLIGTETSTREWVKYEILKSVERGNGILGISIHNIRNQFGYTDLEGKNHFGEIYKDIFGNSVYFWQLYPTYDWVLHNGYNNLGAWIEEAARKVGK